MGWFVLDGEPGARAEVAGEVREVRAVVWSASAVRTCPARG